MTQTIPKEIKARDIKILAHPVHLAMVDEPDCSKCVSYRQ